MDKPIILCVDDEKIILDSLRMLLLDEVGESYDIETAETGAEALEIYEECYLAGIPIPLVISDYIMPGMKGDELLVELHKKNEKIIKILLSGQATLEGVARAFEEGGLYRYLSKPWDQRDLLLTIEEALKSFQQQDTQDELLRNQKKLEKLLAERPRELEVAKVELKKSANEVKTLSGLLPICASCKKIRNDPGYREQVESYLNEHSELKLCHGLCPECRKKL